jgi:hypothetical protein
LQEIPRVDDDLRHSIDRLDNLRFAEEEDRSQKLDLNTIRRSSNNSNYTNPNLDGIIKGNVINTPFYSTSSQVSPSFYSTSSQFPQKRPNSPTNSDMGFFPPNMYDPQINMIKKPFKLNKERLRKYFMSPKYENRRKEFFANFSEFLRNYIRDKYYEFMNDIQAEVNFFEWFDNYFKLKILADRNTNTNSLLQKEATHRHSQNTIMIKAKTPSLTGQNTIIGDKTTTHTSPNILSSNPLTKKHACENSDNNYNKLLILKHQNTDKPHIDTRQRQTLLTSQIGQINTIKKNKKVNIHKDKKKLKKDKKSKTLIIDIVDSPTINPLTKIPEEKAKHKPLCYKCKNFGHYQNNCKPSKLKTPELHSKINSLKQEIKEIKTSSFQITEEQLAQEMITLKINNNNNLQHPSIENEVESEENCKQIAQLITQPNFKETFLNTIDKILFQKWYTKVKIVIDKEYVFEIVALLDTGADSNCIQEGLIPTKYYKKTIEKLSQASGASLNIEFKLSNAHVCRDGVCIKTTFILVKDITSKVILGNPFIALLYPIKQI